MRTLAENPTSSRVALATRTSPRSILLAHSAASGLSASRASPDVSISRVVEDQGATHDVGVVEIRKGLRERREILDAHLMSGVAPLA